MSNDLLSRFVSLWIVDEVDFFPRLLLITSIPDPWPMQLLICSAHICSGPWTVSTVNLSVFSKSVPILLVKLMFFPSQHNNLIWHRTIYNSLVFMNLFLPKGFWACGFSCSERGMFIHGNSKKWATIATSQTQLLPLVRLGIGNGGRPRFTFILKVNSLDWI